MPLLMASSTFKLGRRGEVLLSGVTCIVFIVNICCIFGNTENGLNSLHDLLSDLMKAKYVALERTAEDRTEWQKLLRAGGHTPTSQQNT